MIASGIQQPRTGDGKNEISPSIMHTVVPCANLPQRFERVILTVSLEQDQLYSCKDFADLAFFTFKSNNSDYIPKPYLY